MALGPKQMQEAIIRNLKIKTGKTLEDWIEVLSSHSSLNKKESIAYLKDEHGLGHFQAKTIFEHANSINHYKDVESFANQIFDTSESRMLYSFAKENLLTHANDIRVQPCRTYIPFYRATQFAILTKSKDGLLLGLNLPKHHNYGRFTQKSSKGSERINSQAIIKDASDWDSEIVEAIQVAYNNN